ncbi:integumentary mucin C.1-like [Mizuhopecten yessoensis]|uniref:integumentary mucin C.1-like n=1 Tax=Mizuhopecten yessoensis TaxID=6573 RepID=UPI000B45DEBF|nr:integumentary mucin C.1-like [Mizuhopecten yessoensis]
MRIFVFSLAFCLLLVWVSAGVTAQGPICNTTIVEERVNSIVCGLKRIFGGNCKKIKTKQVCVFPPTTTTLPTTTSTTTTSPTTTSPSPTTTKPTTTEAPATTTTDPTSAIDCSLDTFFPDKDQTKYFQCQGNIPTLVTCPVTRSTNGGPDREQVWDQHSRSCMTTPAGTASCREPTGRQPGLYCNMYIDCQNGVLSKIRCETGFFYNHAKRDCTMNSTCTEV